MAIGAKKITLPITNESTGTVSNVEYSFVQTDNTLAVSGAAADAKKTGDEISALKQDYNQLSETKADKTANNPSMGAGYASQLVSSLRKSDNVPYNFRKVPYDSTLEDGSIVGASVAWNQLFDYDTWTSLASGGITPTKANNKIKFSGECTANTNFVLVNVSKFVEGHKYAIIGFGTGGSVTTYMYYFNIAGTAKFADTIVTYANNAGNLCFRVMNGASINVEFTPIVSDLTQMLGTTIADYVYSLETATAGSGVAWLKEHFPKQFGGEYQAYNAGEIKSISGLAEHKSVGFNAWDEVWELGQVNSNTGANVASTNNIRSKNYIPILPNTTYLFSQDWGGGAIYDINKNYLRSIPYRNAADVALGWYYWNIPDNAYYARFSLITSYGTTYKNDVVLNISKPTGTPKNGDYVAYEEHTYALDSTKTLRGILKLDSNNKLYADGDRYLPDGTVQRNWAEVNLGDLTWTKQSYGQGNLFTATVSSPYVAVAQTSTANFICSKYLAKPYNDIYGGTTGIGAFVNGNTNTISVNDTAYSDAASFKTAMSGVYLVYELATPTTETAEPYGNPQVINPDGTESYVYESGAFELPVGHESEYPVNVSGQLDDILDTPTTNGTYMLQATVTDGAVSYEWVSAT